MYALLAALQGLIPLIALGLAILAYASGCDTEEESADQPDNTTSPENRGSHLDRLIYHHPYLLGRNEEMMSMARNYQQVSSLVRSNKQMSRLFHQNFASAFPQAKTLTPINFVNYSATLRPKQGDSLLFTSEWHQLAQQSQDNDCLTPLILSAASLLEMRYEAVSLGIEIRCAIEGNQVPSSAEFLPGALAEFQEGKNYPLKRMQRYFGNEISTELRTVQRNEGESIVEMASEGLILAHERCPRSISDFEDPFFSAAEPNCPADQNSPDYSRCVLQNGIHEVLSGGLSTNVFLRVPAPIVEGLCEQESSPDNTRLSRIRGSFRSSIDYRPHDTEDWYRRFIGELSSAED